LAPHGRLLAIPWPAAAHSRTAGGAGGDPRGRDRGGGRQLGWADLRYESARLVIEKDRIPWARKATFLAAALDLPPSRR